MICFNRKMVLIDGEKWACEACIKGHRMSSCRHNDRPLIRIKQKGRPITQCAHCRGLRKSRSTHTKCDCGKDDSNESSQCASGELNLKAKFGGRCRCTHGQRCICALKKEYSRSPSRETGLAASQQPAVSEPTNARSSVTVSQDDSNNLGHETNDLPLDRVMPCTPSSYTNSTPKDYLNLAQTMPSNGEDAQIVFGGSTMDDDFPSNLNTFQPGDHPLQHWRAASPLQPDFSAFIGPVTATSSTSWGNSNENFLTTVAAPSGLDSIPLEWTMTSRSDSSFPNMAFEEPNGSTMFSLPTDSFSGTAGLTDLPFDWTSFAPGGSVTVGSQAPSYTTVCPDHAETIRPVPSSDDTLGLNDSVHSLHTEGFPLP